MSVLVKGMKLPQSCAFCGIAIMCYTLDGIHNGMVKKDGRLLSCPLVEVPTPHGRLIDADALEVDAEWSEREDGFTAYSRMCIEAAPTVLEAEE